MNEKVNCTMEEINLMCVYDTDNRYILIEEMETPFHSLRTGKCVP